MKNGGKLKTENNEYNEASDDGNFDVQSKRQATGFNLSLFYNDSHRHIDGAGKGKGVP